jgi:hypothetical protein
MLGERDALGAMLGPGGWGRCFGPRPRAAAHVAIKMLGHPYAQKPTLVARFTQEAPAAASLSHPIVAVFDSGSEAGLHYLVMEYVEAQSAAAAPTSRCRWSTTRPAARPASWSTSSPRTHPDKQVPRAVDGFRQVVSAAASSGADRAYRTCGPGSCRAALLANPSPERSGS